MATGPELQPLQEVRGEHWGRGGRHGWGTRGEPHTQLEGGWRTYHSRCPQGHTAGRMQSSFMELPCAGVWGAGPQRVAAPWDRAGAVGLEMLGGSGHLSPAGQGVLSTLTRGGCCGARDLASAIDLLGTGTGTGRGMRGRHTVPPAWHCHPPSWWPWGCRAEQQRDLVSSPLTRHLSPGLQHSRPPQGHGVQGDTRVPMAGSHLGATVQGGGSALPPVWESLCGLGFPRQFPWGAHEQTPVCPPAPWLLPLISLLPPLLPSPCSLQAMAHAGALPTPEDPKERGGAQPPRRARGDSPHPCPPERQEPSDLPMQQAVSAHAAGCTDPAVPMLPPRLSWGCHCCPPLLFFPKVSPCPCLGGA